MHAHVHLKQTKVTDVERSPSTSCVLRLPQVQPCLRFVRALLTSPAQGSPCVITRLVLLARFVGHNHWAARFLRGCSSLWLAKSSASLREVLRLVRVQLLHVLPLRGVLRREYNSVAVGGVSRT